MCKGEGHGLMFVSGVNPVEGQLNWKTGLDTDLGITGYLRLAGECLFVFIEDAAPTSGNNNNTQDIRHAIATTVNQKQ